MPHKFSLSGDAAADRLLSEDPLALLIGMVLDQQVPLEKAFHSPYDLRERLGRSLDAAAIADMDPDALARVFSQPPALHRFPSSMAKRVREMCRVLVERFSGNADSVWTSAQSGEQLFANLRSLPGFGEQKARHLRRVSRQADGGQARGMGGSSAPFWRGR